MHEYKILTCVVLIVVMPDGWENRQIVFIVRVEAKQQFLSEIPYVGAILSLVSARRKPKESCQTLPVTQNTAWQSVGCHALLCNS